MAGLGLRQTRFIDAPSENQVGLYARTTFAWQVSDTLKFAEDLSVANGKGNDTYRSTSSLTTDIYGGFALRLSFIGERKLSRHPVERSSIPTAELVSFMCFSHIR